MLIMLLSLALAQSPPVVDPCAHDRTAIMAQPTRDFDQTPSGWRSVAKTPGCEAQAADLIKAYRRANWAAHKPAEIHTSYWHEGQMRAAAGQDQSAIPLLMAGVNPYPLHGSEIYAQGTIAFLNRDRRSLEDARARLAALPVPPDWNEMQAVYAPTASARRGRRTSTSSTDCWPVSTDPTEKPMATVGPRRPRTRAPPTSHISRANNVSHTHVYSHHPSATRPQTRSVRP